MRSKLVFFCLTLLYVKTVRTCRRHQQVNLQPYMGTTLTYPEKYPEETGFKANCSWEIIAPSGFDVVVHPLWSCGCRTTIKLYNDTTFLQLGNHSFDCPAEMVDNSKRIIRIGLSQFWLVLSTMSSSDEGGLRFRFMAVEINKGNTCESSGTRLLASRTPTFITSPGFPSQYQPNLKCTWLVETALPEDDAYLVFEFRSQFLEQISAFNGDCFDYVKLDGLDTFCEENEENILQTHSRVLKNKTSVEVSFITDHSIEESGFVLTFYVKESVKILSFRSSDSVLREGKSLWIQAVIKGGSVSSVQWFYNGISRSNTSSRLIMGSCTSANGTECHMLNISRVLPRDEGMWTVKVSDGIATTERSISIKVLPKPVLQMIPRYDFLNLTGDEINIQCSVINPESIIGVTNGSLIWQKNLKEIVSGSGFNINDTNTTTMLTKLSAKPDDSGSYSCSLSGYPDPVLVSIDITVAQPGQKRCLDENLDGIIWSATIVGRNKQTSCPNNQKGTATRYCNLQGTWDSPNLVNCTDEAFLNASIALGSLIEDGVDDPETLQKAVNNTLVTMQNLTSKVDGLSSGDISSSIDILDKIVTITNRTDGGIEKEGFFGVVDNVLSTNNSDSWTAVSEKTDKAVTSLLKSVDTLSEVIMKQNSVSTANFNGKNLELTIDRTKIGETGMTFPAVSPNNISKAVEENATFFELPKQHKTTDKDIMPKDSKSKRMANSNHDKEGEKIVKEEYVDSGILSLSTQTDLGELSPPIQLTFQHVSMDKGSNFQAVCVSWNFTINQWSEKGCTMKSTASKSTVCQCNHLTNFAILMRTYDTDKEASSSLEMLSIIGVILSIAFTILTFVVYILTWKQIQTDQNTLLLNLCGSLVVGYIMFLSTVKNTSNEILCTISTATIHYFFLVTFFCMLGMGIYYFFSITVTYYAMYVANNFRSKSRIHWFLLGGWGFPFVIVASTLGGFWGKGYHQKNYCWLSMESGSLYLFIVPVCIIAVVNVCIILSLIRVLYASSAMKKSSLHEKTVSGLRSLGTLLPVLGVTWILGVLALNEDAIVFQFVFIIANSLQGVFIFLSHVLLNKKLLRVLKTRYPCLSVLTTCTWSRRKELVYVSDEQPSTSRGQLIKELKQTFGKSGKYSFNNEEKVPASDSFFTEETVFSENCSFAAQDKIVVMSDVVSKNEESKSC
ncbi:adhesion G-protein coupled receptor G2-like isoform X2 [Ostrea edulis]|uniref:adhesion G-protein coupled receptor G2-like isoform X2 n=1 Tax=Ostrea edulis TaxID=37623 RepID=UPI0024AF1138|nr:adhesion G-protein coupled receptor G2-like isoform X2 [Ostrea edulis]